MSFPIIHRFVQGGGEEEEKEDNLSITLKAREIHSVALIQAGKNNSFYKQLRDDINDTIINISVGGEGAQPQRGKNGGEEAKHNKVQVGFC